MTSAGDLRGVIIGLLGFAAAEEQMLLAASPAAEEGSPQAWPRPSSLKSITPRRSCTAATLRNLRRQLPRTAAGSPPG